MPRVNPEDIISIAPSILVIVVIAYSKYVSDWLEKGKNQFTYVNPYLKELTFWERIRRIFKNH